ncbi:hypothetical protein MRB53_028780 [Persea americana]|uniref:Uncharacterized protein n=1 Tax=Persea americana TaxID=3435 RepID=A0ACC2KGN9_PERAE|nr:hypothetical protein MRB53_028780 [Persea americana]
MDWLGSMMAGSDAGGLPTATVMAECSESGGNDTMVRLQILKTDYRNHHHPPLGNLLKHATTLRQTAKACNQTDCQCNLSSDES